MIRALEKPGNSGPSRTQPTVKAMGHHQPVPSIVIPLGGNRGIGPEQLGTGSSGMTPLAWVLSSIQKEINIARFRIESPRHGSSQGFCAQDFFCGRESTKQFQGMTFPRIWEQN
jgi:hypothetical protein